jgi:beta-mannosidase
MITDMNQLLMYQYEDKDWEYRTTFNVDDATTKRSVQTLIFEGLDTHADVYLNEMLVLHSSLF